MLFELARLCQLIFILIENFDVCGAKNALRFLEGCVFQPALFVVKEKENGDIYRCRCGAGHTNE